MSDYYRLLSKAVSALPRATPEARLELYARARRALNSQLKSNSPSVGEQEIAAQERALNEAIKRVDQKLDREAQSNGSLSKLFRSELFGAKREAWLGSVQVVQPLPVRIVASVSGVLILSSLVYAAFGTYTRRVHASGTLLPDKGLILIASPAAGTIVSAAISEGQKVHKGQLLYTLNLDATSPSGPTQQNVVKALQQQKQIVLQERQFRLSMAETEKQALGEKLKNLQQQLAHVRSQIEIQRESVSLLKAKADQLKAAVSRGLIRDSDFQNQNYLRMQAVAQQAQYEQLALQLQSQIDEADSALAMFDNKRDRELNNLDRTILQLEQVISENEAKRAIELQAPADGMLTAIRAHSGQQVTSGAPLVTLLPNGGTLKANLFVDSSAIGFIEPGEGVFLRYAPFPFQRFGLYPGKVAEITRAPIVNAGAAPPTPSPQNQWLESSAVYRVVVDLDQQFVWAYGQRQSLEAGTRVEADIALERRPLYSWLLDPVYRIGRSMSLVTGTELK